MSDNRTLINPIEYIDYDICTKCGQKSIEAYDSNNRIIRYSILLNRFKLDGSLSYIDKRPLKKFICGNCKTEFDISWELVADNIRFPIPLTNYLRLEYLIDKFKRR